VSGLVFGQPTDPNSTLLQRRNVRLFRFSRLAGGLWFRKGGRLLREVNSESVEQPVSSSFPSFVSLPQLWRANVTLVFRRVKAWF
jgi:hypothetical protein